jgi:hypothetical protein
VAVYRYWFCDALTRTVVEELPLDCQSFGQQINGVGTLTGTLALGDIPAAVDWQAATQEKRTLLVVQRNDQYVWAGRIMKVRPVDNSTKAEITAETLEGYLGRRLILDDLTYTATDVFAVVRGILSYLQSIPGGDMGLATGVNLAGQTTTITYLGNSETKALDAAQRLAEVDPGFEFTITWARSGNVFTPTLTLAAPALSQGLDPVVFEYPGNVLSPLDTPRDGGDAPNSLVGVGAQVAGAPLLWDAIDTTTEIPAGVPIYEDTISMTEETDAARLQARTEKALAAKLANITVPTVELGPDAVPGFGDFPLGVPCRLRCTCLYHPTGTNGVPGLDITRRVTGWTVNPGPSEKVTLACGATTGLITPPIKERGMRGYLADLARRLLALETA